MRNAFPQILATTLLLPLIAAPRLTTGQESDAVPTGAPWNVNYADIEAERKPDQSLFDEIDCPLELGGWLSAGMTGNAHGNRSGNGNAPLPLNNVADGPVLNQLWLYAEKPLTFEQRQIDWGFRVDYLFGVDGPDSQAGGDQGWDFGWNTSRDYGSAIPQLYAQAGTKQTAVFVGYAYGLLGFETTQAIDNFFYSHNYAFGYGVPGTHSGVSISHQVTDAFEVTGAWVTGWDSWWSNYLKAAMFSGGFTWNLTEQASLTYHLTAGDFGDGTARNGAESNRGDLYSHAIVFTHELSEQATYVVEHTLGSNTGIGADNNRWYSLTGYLFYDFNDTWSAGGRLEWFRDDDGKRVDVNGAGPGSYYEATLGVNWSPHPNLRIRPELRWDWFSGQGRPFDSRNNGQSGTATEQFTAGTDVIVLF